MFLFYIFYLFRTEMSTILRDPIQKHYGVPNGQMDKGGVFEENAGTRRVQRWQKCPRPPKKVLISPIPQYIQKFSLTNAFEYDILIWYEGVASVFPHVASQHTGHPAWLAFICETHVSVRALYMESFSFAKTSSMVHHHA